MGGSLCSTAKAVQVNTKQSEPSKRIQAPNEHDDDLAPPPLVSSIQAPNEHDGPSSLKLSLAAPVTPPPILYIDFDQLKILNEFPRCGDPSKPYNLNLGFDIRNLPLGEVLLIFVSHCWMRGGKGPTGMYETDLRPHPDNEEHHKFALLLAAVERVHQGMAPDAKKIYLWIDFCCINQDGDPAGELKQLDQIVAYSDCILTPLVDEEWDQWELDYTLGRIFVDYKAKRWNEGKYAYLNRGWCRVEMMYASIVALFDHKDSARINIFRAGLKFSIEHDRRLHILFGDREFHKNASPISVPPLLFSFFETYNPTGSNSFVSYEPDRDKIASLVEDIKPFIQPWEIGYVGDRNSEGLEEGYGVFLFSDGGKYEGEFKSGKKCGHGVFYFPNGDKYEGEFANNKRNGCGVYYNSSGGRYEGDFVDDLKIGHGVYYFVDGEKYEGEYMNDKPNGHGVCNYANGQKYDGKYANGLRSGHGVFYYSNGDKCDGEWVNNDIHGSGVYYYSDGRVSDSVYENGKCVSEVFREVVLA